MRQHRNYGDLLVQLNSMRQIAVTIVTFMVALIGCSSDAAGPDDTPASIAGVYSLADVGGNRLPTNIYDGPWMVGGEKVNVRIDVVESELTLDEDGFYSIGMQLKIETGGKSAPLVITDFGEYDVKGGKISFASEDPESGDFSGSLSGGTVSVQIDLVGDDHPPVFRYRK